MSIWIIVIHVTIASIPIHSDPSSVPEEQAKDRIKDTREYDYAKNSCYYFPKQFLVYFHYLTFFRIF